MINLASAGQKDIKVEDLDGSGMIVVVDQTLVQFLV